MMTHEGSKLKHLEAQIFGGAYNPTISPDDIGRKNMIISRKILAKQRIPVVSEDVGGRKERKIVFNTQTNEIVVLKVGHLRRADWYPYEYASTCPVTFLSASTPALLFQCVTLEGPIFYYLACQAKPQLATPSKPSEKALGDGSP
jgi:hypothetical protein